MSEGGFRYTRHVKFYETDLAGVVHFSNYFRYMEEAEHALWRAAGLTVDRAGADLGWPRVSVKFDYRSPLFFEDEFVIVVRVDTVTTRTIQYDFTFTRGGKAIGSGSMITVCATRQPDSMRAVEIPPGVVSRLRAAAGKSVHKPSHEPDARRRERASVSGSRRGKAPRRRKRSR